jgi:hypothetical protein
LFSIVELDLNAACRGQQDPDIALGKDILGATMHLSQFAGISEVRISPLKGNRKVSAQRELPREANISEGSEAVPGPCNTIKWNYITPRNRNLSLGKDILGATMHLSQFAGLSEVRISPLKGDRKASAS